MMRVDRRATAYQAGLPGHEFEMLLVAQADGFGHHGAMAGSDRDNCAP
jgi:hypothetical protein